MTMTDKALVKHLVGRVEARIADADLTARVARGGVTRVHAHTTRGARARRFGGYAREAHVGLSTGCARQAERWRFDANHV